MRIPPKNREYAGSAFCSNFDGAIINREVAGLLTAEKHYADYPAWEWHGDVWFEDGQFHCYVMRYHVHVDTVSADDVEELQKVVCDKWGWE